MDIKDKELIKVITARGYSTGFDVGYGVCYEHMIKKVRKILTEIDLFRNNPTIIEKIIDDLTE